MNNPPFFQGPPGIRGAPGKDGERGEKVRAMQTAERHSVVEGFTWAVVEELAMLRAA